MRPIHYWRKLTRYEKVLIFLFLFSLPLVNPWVRGDGVGYYAYARSLVVNHNLQFEEDWLHANPSFYTPRIDRKGHILADQYTSTGHLDNHFAIGPALIWIPFLAVTHLLVLGFDHWGGHIPANGFSWPYLDTMALITALAGFVGLFVSFRLARRYFPERWAFLATLGIWFASSLVVYMYFNPSWSHAHSAFIVALFVWYWDATRRARTIRQWAILGLLAGVMLDVYYPNAVFLLLPFVDLLRLSAARVGSEAAGRFRAVTTLVCGSVVFGVSLLLGFLPTLITRWIIYGSPLATGYGSLGDWRWIDPLWGKVLFSADHGLFSWTPILLLAVCGLLLVVKRDRALGVALLIASLAFYYLIASYPDWDGISSFGNRFFVSLTPVFILGLAALFAAYEKICRRVPGAMWTATGATALLIFWNLGFVFQWGTHMVPVRGPISWSQMTANQVNVVPEDLSSSLVHYFTRRRRMMQAIEEKDLRQLHARNASGGKRE